MCLHRVGLGSTIAVALAPGLPDVDFSSSSLYGMLENRYGIHPSRARFAIDAIAADARQASLLGLRPGGPLLRCSQITEDERGRTIERCEMVYRGDRYRFRATLVRPAVGAVGANQPEAG
jgi:GntR family transcriptional regulator